MTSVLCYPNPANDRVTVQYMLHESGSVHCVVRDILGNTVESSIQDLEHGIQAFEIDTHQLSNGIYTIELRSNVERVEAKIVIHR